MAVDRPYHRILWRGQPIARATTCKAAAAKVLVMVDAGRGTWEDYRIVYTPTTRQREIARWQVADLMRRGGAANLERAIATVQWLREVNAFGRARRVSTACKGSTEPTRWEYRLLHA